MSVPRLDLPEPTLDLSIIIVNWNTRDLLANCLQSVYDTVRDISFEVIVVDNASTDGSAEMVRERFPQVRLIENAENVGFARANNQAIVESDGENILLLNSDAKLTEGAVHNLMLAIHVGNRIGAAGPTILNMDGTMQSSYGTLPSIWTEIMGPYLFDYLTKPWGLFPRKTQAECLTHADMLVDRVSFACVLISRECLRHIGLLDERYFFYSEDYDWFKRAKTAGWKVVYCPASKVFHVWGGSTCQKTLWSLLVLYRSKRIYYRKFYGVYGELLLRLGLTLRFFLLWLISISSFFFD